MRTKSTSIISIITAFISLLCMSCQDQGQPVTGMVPSVTVHQLNLSENDVTLGPGSQSKTLSVYSTNTDWEFTDIPDWITISPSSGTVGTTNISVAVKENLNTSSRIGVITFSAKESDWNYSTKFTVTQNRCLYYANPETTSLVLDGTVGSRTISVQSNTDTWQAKVPAIAQSWCSISKSNDKLSISVTANTGSVSRSAKIEVVTSESTEYIDLTQRPANISSTTEILAFPVSGGEQTITVESDAPWVAKTASSWLDVTPTSGQSGAATVKVTALPNNTSNDRNGYIYLELSSQNRIEIPVEQTGIKLGVDLTEIAFVASGEKKQLVVTSNVPWHFVNEIPEWISVSPTQGTGNSAITIQANNNPGIDNRKATIHISPVSVSIPVDINISQSGHVLASDSTSFHFSSRSGSQSFAIESDAEWLASTASAWIHISKESGSGSCRVTVSVDQNTSEASREGAILISIQGKTITIPVYQEGRFITVSSQALDFTSKGGSTQVNLNSNVDWTVEKGADWLSVSTSTGKDNGSITITASDNPSSISRKSFVKVKADGLSTINIPITQAARYLRISVDTLSFFWRGGTSEPIIVQTDGECEIENASSWVSVNRLSLTQFTVTVPEYSDGDDRTVTIKLNLTDIKEGSVSKEIVVLQKHKNKPSYVDLGLPSGVKWATFNVGATAPEEYGDYFAWGATEPLYEAGYAQENPQAHWKTGKSAGYCYNNTPYQTANTTYYASTKWTKYLGSITSSYKDASATDTDALKTVLDLEDDAAHANWGGNWRMPTIEEWSELNNSSNCTWTWTTLNGINGYKVQSLKTGYTDKWIFLPAAGYRYDTSLNVVGSYGGYWSSSLYTGYPHDARLFNFGSSGHDTGGNFRYYGRSVRPVCSDDPNCGITGVSLNKTVTSITVGSNETLTATVSKNAGAVNTQVEWSSSNTAVATVDYSGNVTAVSVGTATITARTVVGGFTATCTVSVIPAYEYVDLGLSVKWATFNVGATAPEEYGDYFVWGATEPLYGAGYAQENPQAHWNTGKSDGYCWNNTPYQTTNTTDYASTKWTKYIGSTTSSYKDASATDADALKTVLDLTDDAAHANWGGSWRMPTTEEWGDLLSYCTWTWYSYKGVNGYKVQSRKAGYTDKWIFLPAAGYRYDTYLLNLGSGGSYWSGPLNTGSPCGAGSVYFNSNSRSTSYSHRYNGYSVRPVCSDDPNCGITGVSLNKTVTSITVGSNETLTATVSKNAGAVNTQVEWSSSNTSVATVDYSGNVTAVSVGTATITARTVFGGFAATCAVTVTSAGSTYEYVDLGLSVKWATFNVGATAPEEYGDYFAWGATEPYYESGYAREYPQAHWKTGKSDGYVWNNAPYQTANTTDWASTKWTKYLGSTTSSYKDELATDADALKTVLDLTDDAARANWGGNWRMPTREEWAELNNSNNCTWTWTTINGINGYKVQSKKEGCTDNWIFLPAAGYRFNTSLYGVGSFGYYWSSSLYTYCPYDAIHVYFVSDYHGSGGSYFRDVAHSVRPVCSHDPNIGITGVSLNKTATSITVGSNEALTATVSKNSGAVNTQVEWSSSNTSVATVDYFGNVTAVSVGTATITARTVFGEFTATCAVTVTSAGSTYEYVDLGLSVKWATMNVGATTPEGYGDYFAWGETQRLNHSCDNYKYSYSSSNSTLTKYCCESSRGYNGFNDGKKVLELEDDAANMNWGGKWRTPTKAEQDELRTCCTWTWTNLNGVAGYKIQGTKTDYTDKWIFLPAAGYSANGVLFNVGCGFYWSSTLYYSYQENAYSIEFGSNEYGWNNHGRRSGLSVRPVCP